MHGLNVTVIGERFAVVVLLCAFICIRVQGSIVLSDVTQETGITFKHTDGGSGERYLVETVSAGLALLDYDNDGDVDIYFLNGALLKGAKVDSKPRNRLYRNDGWLDLYVTSYQRQLATLYRNLGDGQFEDVSLATVAGAATYGHVTWGTCIADRDHDGHRDIFVAYGHLQNNVGLYDDTGMYLAENIVLMNTGTGKFMEVSKDSGNGLRVKLSSRAAGMWPRTLSAALMRK